MSITTGASNFTQTFQNGQEVYPCRCGETHSGPWGAYDFGHHQCFHGARLVALHRRSGYYMCPDCGETFWLEGAS